MNFVFRTDTSSEIGHGHLLRCLVLAHELTTQGATVHFICRDNTGSAHNLVSRAGYPLHLLAGKQITAKSEHHYEWLGCSQEDDAEASNKIIAGIPNCHVVVDHYGIDIAWESRIYCSTLTAIDDLADRPHQCTRLIDQSLVHAKGDYQSLIRGDFEFWGGKSVILRSEFRNAPGWKDPSNQSLMVCMGGSDPGHVTIRIVTALLDWVKTSTGKELVKRLDVVIGSAFDAQTKLEEGLAESNLDVSVHRGHPTVSSLMANSSLSLVSCGTMVLEACSLGAPAIGVAVADNQKKTASFLANHKAILRLEVDPNLENNLIAQLEIALSSGKLLSLLSRRAKRMVDKNAAALIAGSFY